MAQDEKQSTSKVLQNLSPQACKCMACEKAVSDLMCGQCYYDRFEKELKTFYDDHTAGDWYHRDGIFTAAKKASGLE